MGICRSILLGRKGWQRPFFLPLFSLARQMLAGASPDTLHLPCQHCLLHPCFPVDLPQPTCPARQVPHKETANLKRGRPSPTHQHTSSSHASHCWQSEGQPHPPAHLQQQQLSHMRRIHRGDTSAVPDPGNQWIYHRMPTIWGHCAFKTRKQMTYLIHTNTEPNKIRGNSKWKNKRKSPENY